MQLELIYSTDFGQFEQYLNVSGLDVSGYQWALLTLDGNRGAQVCDEPWTSLIQSYFYHTQK